MEAASQDAIKPDKDLEPQGEWGKKRGDYDKEKRENLFRELTKPEWTRNRIIAYTVAVVAGLGLIGGGGSGVLLGIIVLAVVGWLFYNQMNTDLDETPVELVREEANAMAALSGDQALEALGLDPDEDIMQSVTLTGPAWRLGPDGTQGSIEGRYRDFMGKIKPLPQKRWLPLRGTDKGYLGARFQIHHIYALEDAIAFFTCHYDIVDGDFARTFIDQYDPNHELVSDYAANKIYYRKIENVRMTQDYLELQMDSGRNHRFGLSVPRETVNSSDDSVKLLNSGDLDQIDQTLMEQGKAFQRAVNQLRDEYEVRHKES